mgnify:CR=1 FL=1
MPVNNKFETSVWNEITSENEHIINDACSWGGDDTMCAFLIALNFIGLFPRPYGDDAELRCNALYSAARVIHNAICALDNHHQKKTKHTTIRDLANAFSYANGVGNKRHND